MGRTTWFENNKKQKQNAERKKRVKRDNDKYKRNTND